MKETPTTKGLNNQQAAVLKHQHGPLLVVAGAGTGKTKVIVVKISKLLSDGVDPAKIVAVTFTEKAAAEMQDRILGKQTGLLPELLVMTFNGFGDMLLREHGINIGIGRNIKLLGPQAQIVFVRERIDHFELDYFLPKTSSPDQVIESILELFSTLKQHIITPEIYTNFVETMPATDQEEELEKKKHQELAVAYQTYTQLCRSENVIDYDDQIYLSLQLLQERPNVRRDLQERFEWLFIDEFQDTNPMQSKLVDLLVNQQKNIVVVGDDDQSIYGFRGATLKNILTFKDRYPDAQEVALTRNYRNYQKILDVSYKLLQHNNPNRLEVSLGIDKKLTSKEPGNSPLLKRFEDRMQELHWLADDIKQHIMNGTHPGDIAVLVRSHSYATKVHDALTIADVDHKVVGAGQDLYSTAIVRTLIELLHTITEPGNNTSLHHTLTSPLFAISNLQVASLAKQAKYEHIDLEELLQDSNDENLKHALDLLLSWREQAATSSVRILIWNAINESGYYESLKSQAPTDDMAANAILSLSQYFDTLRAFESIALRPTAPYYLESLPALMAAGESTHDDTLEITDDKVTVMTVHKAKGLEWDAVYIPGLTEQSFPMRPQGKGLQIPDKLRSVTETDADEHYAEERRLMYVALTRARKNVTLLYADKTESGSTLKPSRFIDELFDADVSQTTQFETINAEHSTHLSVPHDTIPQIEIPEDIYDGTNVRLSVSQATVLLDCPLNFYYKFVLKAPEKPTPSTTYGSQMHGLFEDINKAKMRDELAPLEHYITSLEENWERAGYVSKGTQEKAYKQAHETLTNFYTTVKNGPPPLQSEMSFEVNLQPENILLRGKVDVVLDTGGIEIRDYKTGTSVKDEVTAKRKATSTAQLTMYALAWQIQHAELPTHVSLDYVDTGYIGSVKKTQAGVDGLRRRLADAAADLRNNKFPAKGQHKYCIHP